MKIIAANNQTALVSYANFAGAKEPLATITIEGTPYWIASQVGRALDYANEGSRFSKKILNDWSDRIKKGSHYLLLEGEELARFKSQLGTAAVPSGDETDTESGALFGSRAPQLLLLTEPGLYAAILLSDSPVGLAMMDFLTTDVLPTIRRTGLYVPAGHPLRELGELLAETGMLCSVRSTVGDLDRLDRRVRVEADLGRAFARVARSISGAPARTRRTEPKTTSTSITSDGTVTEYSINPRALYIRRRLAELGKTVEQISHESDTNPTLAVRVINGDPRYHRHAFHAHLAALLGESEESLWPERKIED